MRPAPPKIILRLIAALMALVAWLLVTPAEATGLLIPGDASLGPLAIRSHRVNVEIRERVAETRVVQVFRNHTDRVLEATYIFPIPAGASVSGFAMMVNGQRVEGQVLEANEARGIYEGIVARLRDPGLVEHIGGNLFRARVFPIPPRGDQQVEMRFTQTVGLPEFHPALPLPPAHHGHAGEHDGGLHPQRHHRVAGAHPRGVLPHAPHRHHAPG
jgi:hypothetical protein